MTGSRILFQIVVFGFFLNMSIGLMGHLLPDLYSPGSEFTNGLSYDNTQYNDINSTSALKVTPGSALTSGNGFFSSILDALTGGYFGIARDFIQRNFMGLVWVLKIYFGPYMNPDLSDFLFNFVMTPIMLVLFIFGIVWMFTGRNFFRESL